jgi:hypothetical protein
LRLTTHLCDDRPEARQKRIADGKTHINCVSREESIYYFENNVHGIETLSKVLNVNEEFSNHLYHSDHGESIP